MRFRSVITLALSLAALAIGLAGCGQKGPLVLPKAQVTSPASAR